MARDQTRVLVCAAVSLVLIVAGALVLDWYRLALDVLGNLGKISIDLRQVHICNALRVCTSAPLGSALPGMYPAMAAATLWASLAFAALVVFQAGARLLTGNASAAASKLGYVFAVVTVITVVATAYLFGPETERPAVVQLGGSLHRTWAPLTLILGLCAGFAALYAAAAPEPPDLGAEYRPVALAPARATSGAVPRTSSGLAPLMRTSGATAPLASDGGPRRISHPLQPPQRVSTGTTPLVSDGPIERRSSNSLSPQKPRPSDPISALVPAADPSRPRLAYVAITAELTSGGVDARREDGSSRLVLWRDVVGVVARRLPPELDELTFVDIVSTAGSTLRLVPWTRLSGAPIEDGDARPRGIVGRVVAMCPGARLDPATRHFLDTGEAAQLPDLETLQAHDAHLA